MAHDNAQLDAVIQNVLRQFIEARGIGKVMELTARAFQDTAPPFLGPSVATCEIMDGRIRCGRQATHYVQGKYMGRIIPLCTDHAKIAGQEGKTTHPFDLPAAGSHGYE